MKGRKKQKNLIAPDDRVLFKDDSKSSVPISQGFFDNMASPCSTSAVIHNAVKKYFKTSGAKPAEAERSRSPNENPKRDRGRSHTHPSANEPPNPS